MGVGSDLAQLALEAGLSCVRNQMDKIDLDADELDMKVCSTPIAVCRQRVGF